MDLSAHALLFCQFTTTVVRWKVGELLAVLAEEDVLVKRRNLEISHQSLHDKLGI